MGGWRVVSEDVECAVITGGRAEGEGEGEEKRRVCWMDAM